MYLIRNNFHDQFKIITMGPLSLEKLFLTTTTEESFLTELVEKILTQRIGRKKIHQL